MWDHRTASPDRYALLKEFARVNRKNMTLAESVMWQLLRANVMGHKFLRQHIIGDYIVDFVCRDDGLIVEVDGAYHAELEQQRQMRFEREIWKQWAFESSDSPMRRFCMIQNQ